MSRVKLYTVVSIDGFVSASDGSMDWLVETNIPREVDFGIHSFYRNIETVVMTYGHYLNLASCELLGYHMEKQCVIIRQNEELVISSSDKVRYITDASRDFQVTVEFIRDLKNNTSGDIWISGDDRIIMELIKNDVIDDVILTVLPIALCEGRKVFSSDFNEDNWISKKVYHNEYGVTQIHYRNRMSEQQPICN